MNENLKSMELFKLLKVAEGKVVGERMGRWAEAFEDWIEARKTRFSPNVGADSYTAWREFLAFTGQAPWGVRVPDVEGYVEDLSVRGPCRARPRNHLALTHGLTAKNLPELEWLAEQGVNPEGLDATILRWRVVMRRAMILGNEVRILKEGMRLLDALGTAAVRLAKVLKVRHELREAEGEEAASQAEIEEIWRRLEEAEGRGEKG